MVSVSRFEVIPCEFDVCFSCVAAQLYSCHDVFIDRFIFRSNLL